MTKHGIFPTSLLLLLLIVPAISLIQSSIETKSTILITGPTSLIDFSTVQAATTVVNNEDNNSIEHELRITIAGCGGVTPDEGTHTYENGTKVTITAIESFSAYGTFFTYWLLDSAPITSNNPLLLIMDKDHDLIAVFKGTPQVYNTPETKETTPTPNPSPIPTPVPTPTPTPSPTASPSPTNSPKPLSSQESFPTMTGATASGVSAAIIGLCLLIYFKKHKH
jgi:hypothetical protein